MTPRHKGPPGYTIYKLGSLTVATSQDACSACGRHNHAVSCTSQRSRGQGVVICYLCMTDILANHRDYIQSFRSAKQ